MQNTTIQEVATASAGACGCKDHVAFQTWLQQTSRGENGILPPYTVIFVTHLGELDIEILFYFCRCLRVWAGVHGGASLLSFALVKVKMLLPHMIFKCIYKERPDAFVERFLGGDPDNISVFWSQSCRHPSLEAHPIRNRPDWQTKCVPLELHMDGVPVVAVGRKSSQSAVIYSTRSLLSTGSTLMVRWFLCALWKSLMTKTGPVEMWTRTIFFRKLAWSFFWLQEGVTPTVDDSDGEVDGGGHKLAGGYYGTLWAMGTDLEALAEELFLKSVSQTKAPCNWCECNDSDVPWTDFKTNAKWLKTIWQGQRWLARMRPTNPIFSIPGVTITACCPDWMHDKHIGKDQYTYGSTTKYLTHDLMPGTPEENLSALEEHLKIAYKVGAFYSLQNCLPSPR